MIYWSPNEWDGPRSIHEMLSVEDKNLLKFVPDYRINLITPRDIDDSDFRKFHTVLAEVLQYIKYSKDDEELEKIVNNDYEYKHLDRRSVELINEVTRSNLEIPAGAKEVNMCEALENMKKKAVERNMLESIQNLMKNLKMTAEQAMDALGMSAEDKKRYVQML